MIEVMVVYLKAAGKREDERWGVKWDLHTDVSCPIRRGDSRAW
jgi:hypothetical protein